MSKNTKQVDLSFLAAGSERLVAMPDGERIVPVTINLGEAFDDWVKTYIQTAQSHVLARGGTLFVDDIKFAMYVRTLIWSRVAYVNGRRPVVHPTDLIRVPTFLHVALQGIGRVLTEEVGIVFEPAIDESIDGLLTADEMIDVSSKLAPLEWVGYTMAIGYDRDKKGSYDLMAMQYIQETIRNGVYGHDRTAAIAFAPVAYFLGLRQVTSLLGERIKYADEVTLSTRLRALSSVESRKAS